MRRVLLNISLGASALLPLAGVVAVSGADAATQTAPRAQVSRTCQFGSKPADRVITARAAMRPVSGTQKLAMQFVLQEHPNSGGGYVDDTTREISQWLSPTDPPSFTQDPGYVWHSVQVVDGLYRGFTYRLEAKFRWYGAHDKLIKHESLDSAGCRVPSK